jgi:hypothetical protein
MELQISRNSSEIKRSARSAKGEREEENKKLIQCPRHIHDGLSTRESGSSLGKVFSKTNLPRTITCQRTKRAWNDGTEFLSLTSHEFRPRHWSIVAECVYRTIPYTGVGITKTAVVDWW